MGNLSSVRKGLEILRFLSTYPEGLGLSEMSRMLRTHRSNVYRICQTLVAEGFVDQEAKSRKYRIGPAAFQIGQAYLGDSDLVKVATEVFRKLAPEYTWYFGILWVPELLLMMVMEGDGPVKVTARPGQRRWAHATALGKVLLAGLPEPEFNSFLEVHTLPKITPHTIVSREELRTVIDEVRRKGYAESRNESLEGVSSFAAPVVNGDGTVVAGTSVSLLTQVVESWSAEERQQLINKVLAAASELSKFYGRAGGILPIPPQVARR